MRWACNEKGCYLEQRFDPACLGSYRRGISFGDGDAWIEANSQFLFIEHKPKGYSWDTWNGQYRALKRLANLPGCTVWWIRGAPLGPYEIKDLGVPGDELHPVTLAELQLRIATWIDEADRV